MNTVHVFEYMDFLLLIEIDVCFISHQLPVPVIRLYTPMQLRFTVSVYDCFTDTNLLRYSRQFVWRYDIQTVLQFQYLCRVFEI